MIEVFGRKCKYTAFCHRGGGGRSAGGGEGGVCTRVCMWCVCDRRVREVVCVCKGGVREVVCV